MLRSKDLLFSKKLVWKCENRRASVKLSGTPELGSPSASAHLALKTDQVHEVEWVLSLVHLLVAQCDEETISDKLDVLAHEFGVHADHADRKGLGEELLLNDNGLGNDTLDSVGVRSALEVREQEACKVGVETLVTRDELVREGKSGHQASLLEPEDGRKGA